MNQYVALLRGINVGGNNKVAMPKLKQCLEDLGFVDVITYINSGNVFFKTRKTKEPTLANKIEAAILKTFKLPIPVVVREEKNIKLLCQKIPLGWTNDKDLKTDVLFLWEGFNKPETLKQISANPKVDTLMYVDSAIIWHLKKKNYSKSKMNDIIGTKLYKHLTVRNINTVRKINLLMEKNK